LPSRRSEDLASTVVKAHRTIYRYDGPIIKTDARGNPIMIRNHWEIFECIFRFIVSVTPRLYGKKQYAYILNGKKADT
jgi:hypothetical protein